MGLTREKWVLVSTRSRSVCCAGLRMSLISVQTDRLGKGYLKFPMQILFLYRNNSVFFHSLSKTMVAYLGQSGGECEAHRAGPENNCL